MQDISGKNKRKKNNFVVTRNICSKKSYLCTYYVCIYIHTSIMHLHLGIFLGAITQLFTYARKNKKTFPKRV